MRLILAILSFCMTTGVSAQTLPGPEDYESYILSSFADAFAYCRTNPESSADSLAESFGLLISYQFRDARALDADVRRADARAAIQRMIADGRLISDVDSIRLPTCELTDNQIEARLQSRTANFRYHFTEADGTSLLSGMMEAYGCSVEREDEPAFLSFAIRYAADLYEIPLPDPLPTEETEYYTPFAEELLFVLEGAGGDLRRAGSTQVEDGVVRLVDCVATGSPPESVPVSYGTDPIGAAAHAAALEESDYQAILAQSFADVGCTVPAGVLWLFASHFTHTGLAHLGVDVDVTELAMAQRDLALEDQSEHRYGAAIAAFDFREVMMPTIFEARNAELLDYDAGDVVFLNCTPIGDLSILGRYEIKEE